MNSRAASTRKFSETTSTLMFLTGVLALGLVGFLLLCGLAYAMITENLALGLVCGLALILPYLFGGVWFLSVGSSLMAGSLPQQGKETAEAFSKS